MLVFLLATRGVLVAATGITGFLPVALEMKRMLVVAFDKAFFHSNQFLLLGCNGDFGIPTDWF